MKRHQEPKAVVPPTEVELRVADVPWPKTSEELSTYIAGLVDRPHDYGTSVYAMSMAAVAAYQYVAGVLGPTGFQAQCADLDIIRRTREIEGPFMLIKAEDLLYPQYDLRAQLEKFIAENRSWLANEAHKLLANEASDTHPSVKRHWQELTAVKG